MTTRVELAGGPAAMADLRRWADQVKPAVDEAAGPFADRVADRVRGRVPRRTGTLAGSIGTDADDTGIGIAYDGSVPYTGWIEFGGSRGRPYMPEGRYLYPSALEATDEYARLAGETADDTVGRFTWSTPSH